MTFTATLSFIVIDVAGIIAALAIASTLIRAWTAEPSDYDL